PDGVELSVYEDLALLTAAVKAGKIDAAINDNTVLYDYVADNPDLEVSTEFDTGEQYGFAVAKDGNGGLLKTVNEVLAKAKEDGTYDKLYEKYFGDVPQQ
ncbi:MAG: transporter substrate-binding domain-containing protein, partial [Nocardioidaceae bacterium]